MVAVIMSILEQLFNIVLLVITAFGTALGKELVSGGLTGKVAPSAALANWA